jgi:hypothetical protein
MTQLIGLSPAELKEVTGYQMPKKQIHALAVMDIPFRVRPNGTVFVARTAVAPANDNQAKQKIEPIFNDI